MRYNNYLGNRDSRAYKLVRENNGDVFIVEMPYVENDAVAQYIMRTFEAANGANSFLDCPIWVIGKAGKWNPNPIDFNNTLDLTKLFLPLSFP